jgi:WD40 repeat protein
MSFEVQLPENINCICFAVNGLLYAVGCADKSVTIWAVGKQRELLKFEFSSNPVSLSFDPSDLFLLIALQDGVVHLVDLEENTGIIG